MKPRAFSLLAAVSFLLVLPVAFGIERRSKELPLLTTAERTYWPFTLSERQALTKTGSAPPAWATQYMLTQAEGPVARNPFTEIFRYWVWMSHHPNCEPVGIVFRPDENFPIPDEGYIRFDVENRTGNTLPMWIVGQMLSTASERFVLVSARVERRLIDEFKARGTQVEAVEKFRRELAKQGIAVIELRADTYAVIETPERRSPFPHDRSRAAEFQRDREAWFINRPRYESRGLIYQPTTNAGGDPSMLKVEGRLVRHLAEALAKFTNKEVFVQAAVEKKKFKAPVLSGAQSEVLKQLEKYLDDADVRLVELGSEELGLIEE